MTELSKNTQEPQCDKTLVSSSNTNYMALDLEEMKKK